MKCPNCGRDLLEGEICTCTTVEQDAQTTAQAQPENEVQPETEAPVEAQEVEQQNEQPQPENTYYQPSEPAPQQGEYQNIYQEQSFNQPMYGAPQQNYYDPNQQVPYYNPVMAKPEPSTDYPEDYKPKKKYVAVILAATLGAFGIHNFYLGNNGKATAQLLIALIGSLFFGLGLVVAEIWALVETVQLLTDKIDADANNFKIMTFAEELAKAQSKE